jgi:hypothetical protein
MPGGGELTLVAYGSQNKAISGNPEMTFFYKVFKRHTHFSQESISISMDGPNEMMLDSPISIRAKIPRSADLISDLTFVFNIPDLYSMSYPDSTGNPIRHGRRPAVRWIHMLGPLIMNSVGIYVGGSKVQEFTGEWIALRAQMDLPADKYLKWRTMVGDVPELHTPESGIYAYNSAGNYPFKAGLYPHVFVGSSKTPAPSIPTTEIRVPLPFWFSEAIGKALPLVALQLHEVEVQIKLKSLREVYRVMDNATFLDRTSVNGNVQSEPMRYGRNLLIDPAIPTSFTLSATGVYDNLTLQNNYIYSQPNATDPLNVFYSPTSLISQEGFNMNAHLEGNYIYLTEKEQLMFAERELTYLVHQVQMFNIPQITTKTKLDLDVHGLVHRMVFFGRRDDAIDYRNDYLNLSNWKNLGKSPYWPLSPADVTPNSGQLLPAGYANRDILQSARLICAGNDLFEEKPAKFYEVQVPYMTTTGSGIAGLHPGSLRPDDVMGPVYQIPFAVHGSDHEQPSGTLNTSRLREFQLEVTPWPLAADAPYTFDFTVYVESLNMVKFTNGMGGMSYAV